MPFFTNRMNPKLKKLLVFVVIIVIVLVAYSMFFKGDSATPGLQSSAGTQSGAIATSSESAYGQEFLTLLLNLKKISLDDSLVTSNAFLGLQDFTKVLISQNNQGRPNPFAPIGSDSNLAPTPVTAPVTPTAPTISPSQNGTNTPSSTVTTIPPGSITSVSASLNGILNQSISGSTRWFEWGTSSSNLGTATPATLQANSGGFAVIVSGLAPRTTYYFRAKARVNGTIISGAILNFSTN